MLKKIIKKMAQVLQVVLLAPIKLPGKAVNILKYIAVGLGILETVLENEKDLPAEVSDDTERGVEVAQDSSSEQQDDPPGKERNGLDQSVKIDKDQTGERSEADETE